MPEVCAILVTQTHGLNMAVRFNNRNTQADVKPCTMASFIAHSDPGTRNV